ncbi:MAG: hypothetical protein GX416_11620 [Bacteroidales bacterium]|nr:hypothetical protein [Bacteroidales bacterium]
MAHSACIPDYRHQSLILHSYRNMLHQHIGQILCGYEHTNDCDFLREDSFIKKIILDAVHIVTHKDKLYQRPSLLEFGIRNQHSKQCHFYHQHLLPSDKKR